MSSGKWRPFCPGLNVLNITHTPGRATPHTQLQFYIAFKWRYLQSVSTTTEYKQPGNAIDINIVADSIRMTKQYFVFYKIVHEQMLGYSQ